MYFPKNKIKTGLYTSGNEFVTQNGLSYIGPYWRTANGEYFTGESPNSVPYEKLIIRGISSNTPTMIPVETIFPTEEDYQLGEFQRYFTCRRNQVLFNEITETTYNNILKGKINITVNYKTFSLPWQLTGNITNVYQVNKSVVQLIERKENINGLSNFLNDYIQYYRYLPQENLYTSGSEFLTPNGLDYKGPYHIHPDKGPMVGPTHSINKHDVLTPYIVNTSKSEIIGVGLSMAQKNTIVKTEVTTLQMPTGSKMNNIYTPGGENAY